MIDAAGVQRNLARLAGATPGAFRDDPVFRYSLLGAGLALLAAVANLSRAGNSVPAAPPPPPATLGASHPMQSGTAAPAEPASDPIAPSRSVNDLTIIQDPRGQPDRFGTLRAAQPRKAQSREETP